MNKAYIVWPLLALLLFGARYWYFNQGSSNVSSRRSFRRSWKSSPDDADIAVGGRRLKMRPRRS